MMPASIPVLLELFHQVVLVLAREMRGPRQCRQALRTMAVGAKLHCLQSGKRSLIRMHGLRKAHHAKSNTRRDRQGPEANAKCLSDGSSGAVRIGSVAAGNTRSPADATEVAAEAAKSAAGDVGGG